MLKIENSACWDSNTMEGKKSQLSSLSRAFMKITAREEVQIS